VGLKEGIKLKAVLLSAEVSSVIDKIKANLTWGKVLPRDRAIDR
jgi:hypothetical protein